MHVKEENMYISLFNEQEGKYGVQWERKWEVSTLLFAGDTALVAYTWREKVLNLVNMGRYARGRG